MEVLDCDTPNRPDCLATGMAVEVSGQCMDTDTHIELPRAMFESGPMHLEQVDALLRWILSSLPAPPRVVRNVKIGPSPRVALFPFTACGGRSINNVGAIKH